MAEFALHALHRGRQFRIDALEVVRVARGFDEGADGSDGLGLAQEQAVDAATEELAHLPGVVADHLLRQAVDRDFHHDGRGAVAGFRGAALDQAAHVLLQPAEIEGAMLHADVDVVGPGLGVVLPGLEAQVMTGVVAHVVDGLILAQQFDGAVDTS